MLPLSLLIVQREFNSACSWKHNIKESRKIKYIPKRFSGLPREEFDQLGFETEQTYGLSRKEVKNTFNPI